MVLHEARAVLIQLGSCSLSQGDTMVLTHAIYWLRDIAQHLSCDLYVRFTSFCDLLFHRLLEIRVKSWIFHTFVTLFDGYCSSTPEDDPIDALAVRDDLADYMGTLFMYWWDPTTIVSVSD